MGGVDYQTPARTVKGEHVRHEHGRRWLATAMICITPLLCGCGLANTIQAPKAEGRQAPAQANPGEREGTIPASAARQSGPVDLSPSPQAAVERFAETYINWTWRTLAADQERLAASAVGEARAAELQAAQQTARDQPLARGRIYNTGKIVGIAPAHNVSAYEWVVVTREQTGGNGEYANLAPSFHVTLASVQRVPGGFAVELWRPEL
jgi:hypothetical protein